MKIKDSIHVAIIGLKNNRSRSLLTILGIVIGIAAIITMMSIGKGAEGLILNEIGGLGAETIVIRPGQEPKGPSGVAETIFGDSLKQRDIDFLKQKTNVPDLVDIIPMVIVPGSVSYGSDTYRPTILGGVADFILQTFKISIVDGISFDDVDVRQRAQVALIGIKVRSELFGESEAVGNYIKIKDKKFRVIGIMESKGQVAFFNVDELVVIPYTTAQTYLLGTDYFNEIIVKASSPAVVDQTVRDIEFTLRQSHGIIDPSKDDFFVVTQQGVVEQVGTILAALTVFLSSVVAIALVVGGVGVMNIMLVSVTERIKEIGLRKAVGATEKDILNQFLFEAVILTSIGGVIGIILGAVLSLLAAVILTTFMALNWSFVFPWSAAVIGLAVSAAVGLVFGIYPARQAAKKDPIEALRYE